MKTAAKTPLPVSDAAVCKPDPRQGRAAGCSETQRGGPATRVTSEGLHTLSVRVKGRFLSQRHIYPQAQTSA